MFEVITSEAAYLCGLLVAVLHFQNSRLLRGMLAPAELHGLFSNLSQIKDVSEKFLLELEQHLDQDVFLPGLGGIIHRHCPAFRRAYVPYITNQAYQEQLMQKLMQRNSRFLQALRQLEEQPICQRQALKSFLVLPFQRLTRLKVLLEHIFKLSPANLELVSSMGTARQEIWQILGECNTNVGYTKQVEELVMLEKQLDFTRVQALPLIRWGHWLVHQGALLQVLLPSRARSDQASRVTLKAVYLHLFSDLLLASRHKGEGRFSVKEYAWTCHVEAELLPGKPRGLPDWTVRLSMSQSHAGGSILLLLKAARGPPVSPQGKGSRTAAGAALSVCCPVKRSSPVGW